MSQEFIEAQRELLIGRRVRCIQMDDPHPVPSGTEGTVEFVDDMNQIHVKWDNGSTLALIPESDTYELLDKKCHEPLFRDCHLFYNNKCKGCPKFF
jgi:hypothetical protein